MKWSTVLFTGLLMMLGCSSPQEKIGDEVIVENHDNPAACPEVMSLERHEGHCALGTHCEYPEGFCMCDGYHGGIEPLPDRDYSHWVCARTKNREDGCPDDLGAGIACSEIGKQCLIGEGLWCGPTYLCDVDSVWKDGPDTCAMIP